MYRRKVDEDKLNAVKSTLAALRCTLYRHADADQN